MPHVFYRRSTIAAAFLTSLSACSSSSDGPTDIIDLLNVTDVTGITQEADSNVSTASPDTPDNTGSTDSSDTTNSSDSSDSSNSSNSSNSSDSSDSSDPVALFGPARFITSECGSVLPAGTATTNSRDNPSVFFVGELVDGQLVPGSNNNGTHFWQIELEAGNYHLVVDSSDAPDRRTALAIEVNSIGSVTAEDESLINDADFDFNLRSYEYLEIRNPQVLTLQVETAFEQIHDYTLGIFRNGTAVPSPTFFQCLPVNSLALGATQSVTLQGPDTRENDAWYQLELDSGAFTLDVSTSSAEQVTLGYDFTAFTGFGENANKELIALESVFGTNLSSRNDYENAFEGTVWLRARNQFENTTTLEFTFNEL